MIFNSVRRILPIRFIGHNGIKTIRNPLLIVPANLLDTCLDEKWSEKYKLTTTVDLQSSGPLPFANRLDSLNSTSKILLDNSRKARYNPIAKEIFLPCSGLGLGAGKTTFGSMLALSVQNKLSDSSTVVYCHVPETTAITSFGMLFERMIKADRSVLGGLREKIDGSMSLQELLKITSDFLTEKQLHVLLHLDEFDVHAIPETLFKTSKPGIDAFYQFWVEVFLPILRTPRLMLYVSGKSTYLDQIGINSSHIQAPTLVWNVPLELLKVQHIEEVLDKFLVYQPDGEFKSLAVVLQSIISSPQQESGTVRTLAEMLLRVSAGVPGYVQHSLGALLAWDPVSILLIRGGEVTSDQKVPLDRIRELFEEPDGLCMVAVTKSSSIKGLQERIEKEICTTEVPSSVTNQRLFDLLTLLALDGVPIDGVVTEEQFTKSSVPLHSLASKMLAAAQKWGFYPTHDPVTSALTFRAPKACLSMLRTVADTIMDKYFVLDMRAETTAGVAFERAVLKALIFDRVWYTVRNETESLLAKACGETYSIASLQMAAERVPFSKIDGSVIRALPPYIQLPTLLQGKKGNKKVKNDMVLQEIQAFSEHHDPNRSVPKCNAKSIANVVGSRKFANMVTVFSMSPDSTGADKMMRLFDTIYHITAKDCADCDALIALVPQELQRMLENVAAYNDTSLRHVLVIAGKNCDLSATVKMWSDMVTGDFSSPLTQSIRTKLIDLTGAYNACVKKGIAVQFVGLDAKPLSDFLSAGRLLHEV